MVPKTELLKSKERREGRRRVGWKGKRKREEENEKKNENKSRKNNGLQVKIWSVVSIIYCCITNFLKRQWLKITSWLFIYLWFSICTELSRECSSLLHGVLAGSLFRAGEFKVAPSSVWHLSLDCWLGYSISLCILSCFKADFCLWELSPASKCSSWLGGCFPKIGSYKVS